MGRGSGSALSNMEKTMADKKSTSAEGAGKQAMTAEKCKELGLDPTVYGHKAEK